MIPQAFIQDLLSRLDIVDVIGRRVALKKKSGSNYVACCPFHNEKTPSFSVSPTKQFYHCFGCGEHGNAIDFVMAHQGLTFVDAIEELAGSLGLTVPREAAGGRQAAAPRREEHAPLADALRQATDYYREQLKRSPAAIRYLQERGLDGRTAARFGIGYAPDGWQNLAAAVKDYQDEALVKAGLVIVNDAGRRYDRFRDRIMFPIVGARGQIIGFGGRVLGKGEPKYLNSPETPLFEKGRELYGLSQARRAIRDAGRVLVVEGYMDVVALSQFGIHYAVATLGTATTPTHVQQLMRHTDRIVYCFDGDAAGRRAAWRALENSLEPFRDGKEISFLFLPKEDDPDSFVRREGQAAFERQLGQALPLSRFLLQELAARNELGSQEGRVRCIEMARPLVAKIAAPVFGLLLKKELAAMVRLEVDELETLLGGAAPAPRRGEPPSAAAPRDAQEPPPEWEVPWPDQAQAPSGGGRAPRRDRPGGRDEWRGRGKGRRDGWEPEAPRRPDAPQRKPSSMRLLLRIVVQQPHLAARVDPALVEGRDAAAEALRDVLDFLRGQAADRRALLARFAGSAHGPLLASLAEESLLYVEQAPEAESLRGEAELEAEFEDLLARMARQKTERRLARLLAQEKNGGLSEAERAELMRLLTRKA